MIKIFRRDNHLCVQMDPYHPAYQVLNIIVRSLLSARALDENTWIISYSDLQRLRKNLDMSGLTEGRYVTEDAFSLVSWIHDQREKNIQLKKGSANEQIKQALAGKLKTPLYEDQFPAIAYAVRNRRSGIFDDMGTGKSLEALASVVFLGSEVRKTLLVSPYTVQIGFMRQIREHTHLKGLSVPNGREQALEFLKVNKYGDWDILLVHPENLISTPKSKVGWGILNLLADMTWDLILVDEFHMYQSLSAKRTHSVLSLLNDTRDRAGVRPRAILMTGTPVSESPLNAYVALKALSLEHLPNITRFEDHFIVKKKVTFTKTDKKTGKKQIIETMKVTGYKNLDELKELIESVSIRRTKEDLKGFPDRVLMIRDVVLEGQQLKLYRALCHEVAAGLDPSSQLNMEKFFESNKTLRLRQLMNHPALLGEEGDSAKYQECDSILEEVLADPEAKVLIWTEYRAAVDLLYERYKDTYGAVRIYGGVDNKQLEQIQEEFENNARPRVAVCIPAKAGTGVDFLARARTAIYIDRPYKQVHLKQSLDRIHRRVSAEKKTRLDVIRSMPATCIFLDVVDSLDVLIRDRSVVKQNLVDALTVSDEKLIQLGRSDVLKFLGKA